jgi:hypothetical protein
MHQEYFIKDHLGNVRVRFEDINEDGQIQYEFPVENEYEESELIASHHYYPFGMEWKGYFYEDSNKEIQRKRYNGKEFESGVGLLDYGACSRRDLASAVSGALARPSPAGWRGWYEPAVVRWNAVDPLADAPLNVGTSPYAYVWNNPLSFIDPDGRHGETTIVGENEDGTYTVKDWVDDGSTDIITEDGEKIGESLTTHSFVGDDGKAIEGAIIDINDNSGQEFFDSKINEGKMWVWSYMPNATGGKDYDFKREGANPGDANYNNPQYHYRGMPLNGKIASARDIGNYAAGAVAGANGYSWNTARLGFDGLQKWQDKNIFSVEGTPTQLAQKEGHNSTYPQYLKKELKMMQNNPMYKVIPKW